LTASIRIVLDEAKFRRLVSGEPMTLRGGVEIVVDLGWRKMVDAILDAAATVRNPPDPPQAREFLPWSGRRRSR
jgi:hypothetical protein